MGQLQDYATLSLPLTPIEKEQLEDYEATITRGLNTFYEVGAALVAIKTQKLYRAEYRTFEEYCTEKWHIGHSRAYQLIEAAAIKENLSTMVDILPENERQVRELKGLEPDQQRQVWAKAVDTAPNGKITAQHIKDVRQAEIPMPEPAPKMAITTNHPISVFIPPDSAPVKNCKVCQYHKNMNSHKEGVHIPGGTGKCTRPGGHCNPEIVAGYLTDYGKCAKCGTRLTGPGHAWFDSKHHDTERICDDCQPEYVKAFQKDMQRDPVDHALHAELEDDDEPEPEEDLYHEHRAQGMLDDYPDEREPEDEETPIKTRLERCQACLGKCFYTNKGIVKIDEINTIMGLVRGVTYPWPPDSQKYAAMTANFTLEELRYEVNLRDWEAAKARKFPEPESEPEEDLYQEHRAQGMIDDYPDDAIEIPEHCCTFCHGTEHLYKTLNGLTVCLFCINDPSNFYMRDREKIVRAGLRLLKPGGRMKAYELQELLPMKSGTKSPSGETLYSFRIIEKFETKAAMQRRIKELEQNDQIVFESRL